MWPFSKNQLVQGVPTDKFSTNAMPYSLLNLREARLDKEILVQSRVNTFDDKVKLHSGLYR